MSHGDMAITASQSRTFFHISAVATADKTILLTVTQKYHTHYSVYYRILHNDKGVLLV